MRIVRRGAFIVNHFLGRAGRRVRQERRTCSPQNLVGRIRPTRGSLPPSHEGPKECKKTRTGKWHDFILFPFAVCVLRAFELLWLFLNDKSSNTILY